MCEDNTQVLCSLVILETSWRFAALPFRLGVGPLPFAQWLCYADLHNRRPNDSVYGALIVVLPLQQFNWRFGIVVAHWPQSPKLLCAVPVSTGTGDH